MAGQLTKKQKDAIATLKPHELKIRFICDPRGLAYGKGSHELAVEYTFINGIAIKNALVDLLPNADDPMVSCTSTTAEIPAQPVIASIIYEDVTPHDNSPVKEVATLLADNGVNFPGNERFRTRTKP